MLLLITLVLVSIVGQSYGSIGTFTDGSVIFYNGDSVNDIIEDVGSFTPYMNCDQSSFNDGSIGDFETTRRCRAMEVQMKQCMIPCEKPLAMECRSSQIHTLTAEVIYKQCLNLTDEDTDPTTGLYAKDVATRPDYGGACNDKTWKGEACKDILGARCDAPDSECRRYCAESKAERDAYCAQRMKEISTTRTLAVKALKSLVQEKMKDKRSLFQDSQIVRAALSRSFNKRALADNENEELMLLSGLLKDDTIDWEN